MKELSPEARAILDAASCMDDPSSRDRARVHKAVLAAVSTGTAAAVSATVVSTASASTATSGGVVAAGVSGLGAVAVKAAVALTIVSATVGVAVTQPWQSPELDVAREAPAVPADEPAVRQPEFRIATPLVAAIDEEATELEVEAPVEPEVPVEPEAVVRPRRVAHPDTVEEVDTLPIELELIRRAQAQLRSGDHASALATLNEHSRRFPHAMLVAEREGTRALVLCGRQQASGRQAALSFLGRYPRSPLAGRVRQACDL